MSELSERLGIASERDPGGAPLVVSRVDRDEDVCLIAVGEIDAASAPLLASALDQAIACGDGVVQVDLGAVQFMDSSGVNALLNANQRRRVHLTAVHPAVERVLQITGVLDLLRNTDGS